jgi:hypothetical protein
LYQELPFFQVPSPDWALFFFFFEPGNSAYATALRLLLVFLALLLLARGLFFLVFPSKTTHKHVYQEWRSF